MYIKGVSSFDLFYSYCQSCECTTVHGFIDQIYKEVKGNKIRIPLTCDKCKRTKYKIFNLSTGYRHKLLNWHSLLWPISKYLNRRFLILYWQMIIWLDERIEI